MYILVLSAIIATTFAGKGQGKGQGQTKQQFRNALLNAIRNDDSISEEDVEEYTEFCDKYGKFGRYFNPGDLRQRYSLFQESKSYVASLNANPRSQISNGKVFKEEFGLTKFSDWTVEEKLKVILKDDHVPDKDQRAPGNAPIPPSKPDRRRTITTGCTEIPANHWDDNNENVLVYARHDGWAHTGAIKDQGQTGGCWVFAATAQFESNYKYESGITKVFSEQYAVDCSDSNTGTVENGGWPEALTYDYEIKGACGNYYRSWPAGGDEWDNQCHCSEWKIAGHCFEYVGSDKTRIAKAVSSGHAFSFGMMVDNSFYYLSGSGPLSGSNNVYFCGTDHIGAHAMTMVGEFYGEYIWVRNSWGSDWGYNGYTWIHIDSFLQNCGLGYNRMNMNWNFWTMHQLPIINKDDPKMLPPPNNPQSEVNMFEDFGKNDEKYIFIALSPYDYGNILSFLIGCVLSCFICGGVFMYVYSKSKSKSKQNYATVSQFDSGTEI